jgi:hypothetical protein
MNKTLGIITKSKVNPFLEASYCKDDKHEYKSVKTGQIKSNNGIGMNSFYRTTICKTKCRECKKEKELKTQEEMIYIKQSDTLNCEKCGVIIGYAYENDLNGSHFYCVNCKKNYFN